MKRTLSRRLAVGSGALILLAFVAQTARPARRPRYGGTLRVEIGASVNSIDPSVPAASAEEAAAKREIESLIYANTVSGGSVDGVAGSGAFRISEWEPGKQLILAANDDAPGGRPFVDAIEIDMGDSVHDRLVDLEVGRSDFSEIPAEDSRQASAAGIRIAASQPDQLIAMVFLAGRPAVSDARLRQALSCSVNRSSIVDFILQKQGEPAGGLLPQWSSGTAFLFSTAADPVHAKELRLQITGSPLIRLGYDSRDALEQSIADRIAVDAREAGIAVVPQGIVGAGTGGNIDAALVRARMISPHSDVALTNLLDVFNPLDGMNAPNVPKDSPQEVYTIQRAALDGFHVVPLVWIPRVYGLSDRVRDWQTPATGDAWPLADVWLDTASGNVKQN